MTIQGITFDLEGTCIDLESLHFLAYQKALADIGIVMSLEEILALAGAIGGGTKFVVEEVQKMYPEKNLGDFCERKKVYYQKAFLKHEMQPREGLVEVLKLIQSLSLPIALGSRTSRKQGEYILAQSGLDMYFTKENTVFAEDVINHKPAPDVYLKTAEIMRIEPQNQLVFEDSVIGIESSVAAFSPVIAIPSPLGATMEYIQNLKNAGALQVISSWNEITADFLSAF